MFSGCSGLTNVTIPNSVTAIVSGAFDRCTGLKSVTLGNSVAVIGWRAFNSCSSLTSINIPSSVTELGGAIFEGSDNITRIDCYPNPADVVTSYYNSFSGLVKTCTLHVLPQYLEAYQILWPWNRFTNIDGDLKDDVAVSGDVDGKDMVDVRRDGMRWINLILNFDQYKDKYPGSADLDGNGMVDVDDVNALINIILSK